MYEKLKQLIHDLEVMNRQPFIGYGKPDADILIVGKECAFPEGSKDWKLFYEPNFAQWKESFEGHGFARTKTLRFRARQLSSNLSILRTMQ